MAVAQAPARRFAVTPEMVIAAMQQHEMSVDGLRVRIAAPMTAAVASPMLEIQSVVSSDQHSAQLRIACRDRSECLSFYATATWSQNAQALVSTAVSKPQVSSAPVKPPTEDVPAAARAGDHAILLIDSDRIHISVHVVCLQSGGIGERIRVATPDHRQAFEAEVVSSNVVRGIL